MSSENKRRILFVDDESKILGGLRRMLRQQRQVWDMSFATSGREALAMMEEEVFDVIVSDMKMPEMDGAALLGRVKEAHPAAVRLVLSGHADMEAAMRSVSVAHQFLAKPCEAVDLKLAIERTCGLRDLLDDPALQSVLGRVSELPVLPRTYKLLTEALQREDVDIEEVGDIVEQDSAIAAKVLQLVNSSFFGLRAEIVDLHQAAAYLGISTLKDLVLSFGLFNQFESNQASAGFPIEHEQSHALLTARIARRIGKDGGFAEEAFLAGMMHDIGKLVLAISSGDEIRAKLASIDPASRPRYLVEREALGVSHAEIGAYLLGVWGMRHEVVEAVAHHHEPRRVEGQTQVGVLAATHVADVLAKEQAGMEMEHEGLDEGYLELLGARDALDGWRQIAVEEAGGEPVAD